MEYLVSRVLILYEDGSTQAFELDDKVEDLSAYKEEIIKNHNAVDAFLNYEQEDSDNSDSSCDSPSLTDFIKPLASGI